MKKFISLCAFLALSLTINAQLAWDTEFSKNDFNNAQTVISMTDNVSWASPDLFGLLGGGIQVGKLVIIGSAYSDECVIALPQTGIPEKISFSWHGGGSSGTVSVYQSADHNNWSLIFTSNGNADAGPTNEEALLATTTKYIKFAATGKVAATFRNINVTELKSLSASTDEWPFGIAMVDDADAVKSVTVSWTNIVADVTSTDSHFTASLSSVGQKNLINQSTMLNIFYSHDESGTHSGEIVIAGEGREVRISVSGETKKYNQTLTWIQDLNECDATEQVYLNAFTSSGLDVVYESSDEEVATVENGLLQIHCAGQVTLTATQPGNYKFNEAAPIAKNIIINKVNPMIGVVVEDITYGQSLSEVIIEETLGQVEGTFEWLNIASDTILNAGDYALTLLFTPSDTCIFHKRTLQVPLHVAKAVQTIIWEEQETELTVGNPVASTAVLSSGMQITYAYTECLLSIENGMIMPENEGEVTVIAYHPGNENYLPTTVIMTMFTISAAPSNPTGIGQLSPEQQVSAQKFMHEGKVYLYFAGHMYNSQGKLIQNN